MNTRTIRVPWPGRRLAVIIGGFLAIVALLASTASACSGNNGQKAEGAAQSAGSALLEQNQPLPVFKTSALRLNLIEIEAIQALGTPTTTFFFPPGASPNSGGAPIDTCPSQGEPVPNTASLSNPLQPYTGSDNTDGSDVVDQMDPNGIYAPTSSSGTYVLCVTPSGGVALHYWEGDVYTTSGAAVWDAAAHQIRQIGPSELPVCTIATSTGTDGTGLQAGTQYYHCVAAPK
jgi:hypothetical protein